MNDIYRFIKIVESFLLEDNRPLSKGSQLVMSKADQVKKLADRIRFDIKYNPSSFDTSLKSQSKRMSDSELANWFLQSLDKIERAGYAGNVYSRDGVNSQWLANYYIKGNHNWEDISGTANMNLSKWYFLKNRNLLKPEHNDVQKFQGIRDLGGDLVYFYQAVLDDFERSQLEASMKKMVRAFKIVDNQDYRIYISLNRSAGITLGLGTNWCTANSTESNHFFNTYASRGMLFQLFPKNPDPVTKKKLGKDITGTEKFQFDQSGPHFMDIADDPVPSREVLRKFPYLYDDLVTALTTNKSQLQSYIDELQNDETLTHPNFGKPYKYEVDAEIKKLQRFIQSGYMQETPRPPQEPETEPEVPALPQS